MISKFKRFSAVPQENPVPANEARAIPNGMALLL